MPHSALMHDVQEARAAQQQTDGWALTKTITFKVTMFDDFEKFGRVPDEYEKPERQPYAPQVPIHSLPHWLHKHKQSGCATPPST